MAPPSYADLGKACRDVFDKGYNLGTFRLTTNQSTCGGINFKSDLTHKFEDTTFAGSLEAKSPLPFYGLTLTNRWFTNNFLLHGLSCNDVFTQGLKFGTETMWNPQTGEKTGKVIVQCKKEFATLDFTATSDDFLQYTPNVLGNISLVLGYSGWLAGAQCEVEKNCDIKSSSFTLGHSYGDVQAMMTVDVVGGDNTYKGSIFQRVTDRLESGILFGWGTGGETAGKNLAIAGRYLVDSCSSIRGKVNHESVLSLGYESLVRDGVTVSIGTEMDLKSFTGGEHKFGIGLDFEK